jgi:hypothetical protein
MQINITLPTAWKELTPRQLLYISFLITQRELTPVQLRTAALIRFSGIRILEKTGDTEWYCRYQKQEFILTDSLALALSNKLQFLTATMGEITPLPQMGGYIHVDPRLHETPFRQYVAAENYFQAFIFTRKEHFLNCLCAVFYSHKKNAKNRPTDTFNDGQTDERARTFQHLPLHVRYTAFLWYYGLKNVLANAFPHFFVHRENNIEENEKTAPPNMRLIINSMIRALTGGDVTKTDTVYLAETWAALAELDAKALEYKEYEKRINKFKNTKK